MAAMDEKTNFNKTLAFFPRLLMFTNETLSERTHKTMLSTGYFNVMHLFEYFITHLHRSGYASGILAEARLQFGMESLIL